MNPEVLPPKLLKLIEKYPGRRQLDVFVRSYQGAKYLVLKTVPNGKIDEVATVSTIGIIVNVFLDDWADQYARRDLIEEANAFMFKKHRIKSREIMYLEFIWRSYWEILNGAESIETVREELIRAWENLVNAMVYTIDINLGNIIPSFPLSLDRLSPNMHYTIKHLVDVAFSPNWNPENFEPLKKLSTYGERVTRIGNWIKSWEIEVSQFEDKTKTRDISSGVIAYAVDKEIITMEQLRELPSKEVIKTIKNARIEGKSIIDILLTKANSYMEKIAGIENIERIVDVDKYMEMLKIVITQQLKSSGEAR